MSILLTPNQASREALVLIEVASRTGRPPIRREGGQHLYQRLSKLNEASLRITEVLDFDAVPQRTAE